MKSGLLPARKNGNKSNLTKKSDLSKKLCVGAVESDVVGEIDVDADDGVV